MAYDPKEARDKNGKWTSTGNSIKSAAKSVGKTFDKINDRVDKIQNSLPYRAAVITANVIIGGAVLYAGAKGYRINAAREKIWKETADQMKREAARMPQRPTDPYFRKIFDLEAKGRDLRGTTAPERMAFLQKANQMKSQRALPPPSKKKGK